MINISNLLKAISEETIAEEVWKDSDLFRKNYSMKKNTVKDFDEFRIVVATYYQKHHSHIWTSGRAKYPIDYAEEEAFRLLRKIFRTKDRYGFRIAYHMAQTGENGGLKTVLDAIHMSLREEQERGYISAMVRKYVGLDPDIDTMEEIAKQYAEYINQFLPEKDKINNPIFLLDKLATAFYNHYKLMRQLKKIPAV